MSKFPMVKTIGIICKHDKPEAYQAARGLVAWLEERGVSSLLDSGSADFLSMAGVPVEDIPDRADAVVVFGGDGTLLAVARLLGGRGKPIVGVNLGTLGFITAVPLDHLYPTMEKVLSGQYKAQERMMLHVLVRRKEKLIEEHHVLNDMVINKGALARIIYLETYIDDSYLTTFKADGLIIHTPTGSTGYCLSAGGPIVHPILSCLGITPICPHTLTDRPLILPDAAVLEVVLKSDNEDVYLTLDGQVGFALKHGDIIEAKKSEHSMYFIMSPQYDYYHMLRTKLRWGER
jgi:NAD+ kinase